MAQQYASKQPAGYKNHVENVAIVGATGSVGKFFTEHVLATGKHKVTAITRGDITVPSGVSIAKVDYTDQTTLVAALKGQDVLIITMAPRAPEEQQTKLINAAAEAGVPFIFPNEYGYDMTHPDLATEIFGLGEKKAVYHRQIEELGVSSWIGLTCGFWYEFSLGGGAERCGFDFGGREVTFFDEGEVRQNVSTWPQCGRAMAALLCLKVLPENEADEGTTLSRFKNDWVFISSFKVNQKEMFESVLRVTGKKKGDWKIGQEGSKERFKRGFEKVKGGDMLGFAQVMYSRLFFDDGSGDFEARHGLHNAVLGLPVEDLDEYTNKAIEFAEKHDADNRARYMAGGSSEARS